jgi:hypothetical protein
MAEQTVSTPQSSNENSGPKIAKDRACPFCNQAFTSSSLGRHLDLYIKPKNPKPPDGVHNVDEIRRMRGNITRRQSRISSVKRDSSTPAPQSLSAASSTGANATVRQILESTAATHTVTPSPTDPVERFEEKMGVRFNKPGWESTGVMNNLPPRLERLEPRPDVRRDLPKHHMLKSDMEQRKKIAEELENGRAAELALQEVLGSVRDARYVAYNAGWRKVLIQLIARGSLAAVSSNSTFLPSASRHSVYESSPHLPPYSHPHPLRLQSHGQSTLLANYNTTLSIERLKTEVALFSVNGRHDQTIRHPKCPRNYQTSTNSTRISQMLTTIGTYSLPNSAKRHGS